MFNCKHLRHRTVLARFSLATFLLQQWRGHGSFSSFAGAELDQWVLTPALRHPLSSSSYSFWMVLFINLASTLVVIGYTYRTNQKGNIRIRGKQFTEGAKMKYTTLHYTHKFLHFVMEKYCYSIFWTLSEIMPVCVWCDWMLLIVMSICAVIHWMAVLILVFRVVTPSQLTVSAVWRVMNSQN